VSKPPAERPLCLLCGARRLPPRARAYCGPDCTSTARAAQARERRRLQAKRRRLQAMHDAEAAGQLPWPDSDPLPPVEDRP
jgi:hypothetical protein